MKKTATTDNIISIKTPKKQQVAISFYSFACLFFVQQIFVENTDDTDDSV